LTSRQEGARENPEETRHIDIEHDQDLTIINKSESKSTQMCSIGMMGTKVCCKVKDQIGYLTGILSKKFLTVLILFVFLISAVSNSFQIPSNSNSGKLVQKSVLEKGEQINN
jgi:hypothetical protein